MAACTSIACRGGGGNCSLLRRGSGGPTVNAPFRCVVPCAGRGNLRHSAVGRISMSMAVMAPVTPVKLEDRRTGGGEKHGNSSSVVSRETLDDWMKDSVAEIVKNLREAPLLVHMYGGDNGTLRTKTETATDWEAVKGRWEKGEARLPEGVILVEKLDDDVTDRNSIKDHPDGDDTGDGGPMAWGIVAQGRGVDCGPVCYLLKTSRIGSGSGAFCTHFCLVRVKSFRETAKSQLANCWLLQKGQ